MVWLTPVLGIVMMCVECVEGAPKKVGQKAGTNQQTRQEKSTKKHRLRQARSPGIRDATLHGFFCRAIIAITEALPPTDVPSFGTLVDARFLHQGWRAYSAIAGVISCNTIRLALQRDTPTGWCVGIKDIPDHVDLIDVSPGQVLVAFSVRRPIRSDAEAETAVTAAGDDASQVPGHGATQSALSSAPAAPTPDSTATDTHTEHHGAPTAAQSRDPRRVTFAAESYRLCSFLVLGQNYLPEHVEVRLPAGISVAQAIGRVSDARAPDDVLRLPMLCEVFPQPQASHALCIATPSWETTGPIVAFDSRSINGRLFALQLVGRVDRAGLLTAAQLDTATGIEVYIGSQPWPLPDHHPVTLFYGELVFFTYPQAPHHVAASLQDMLNDEGGWVSDFDPASQLSPGYNSTLWLLGDEDNLPFELQPHRRGQLRADIARLLNFSERELVLQPAHLVVPDYACRGIAARTLLAALHSTEFIEPDARPVICFIDARPIMLTVKWRICPRGILDTQSLFEVYASWCPLGLTLCILRSDHTHLPLGSRIHVEAGEVLTILFLASPPRPDTSDAPSPPGDDDDEGPGASDGETEEDRQAEHDLDSSPAGAFEDPAGTGGTGSIQGGTLGHSGPHHTGKWTDSLLSHAVHAGDWIFTSACPDSSGRASCFAVCKQGPQHVCPPNTFAERKPLHAVDPAHGACQSSASRTLSRLQVVFWAGLLGLLVVAWLTCHCHTARTFLPYFCLLAWQSGNNPTGVGPVLPKYWLLFLYIGFSVQGAWAMPGGGVAFVDEPPSHQAGLVCGAAATFCTLRPVPTPCRSRAAKAHPTSDFTLEVPGPTLLEEAVTRPASTALADARFCLESLYAAKAGVPSPGTSDISHSGDVSLAPQRRKAPLYLADHLPSFPTHDLTQVGLNLPFGLDAVQTLLQTHWHLPTALPVHLRLHAATRLALDACLCVDALPDGDIDRCDIFTDGQSAWAYAVVGHIGGASFLVGWARGAVALEGDPHHIGADIHTALNGERTALFWALAWTLQFADRLPCTVWVDSQVASGQTSGRCGYAASATLAQSCRALAQVAESLGGVQVSDFHHVRAHQGHAYNELADTLAGAYLVPATDIPLGIVSLTQWVQRGCIDWLWLYIAAVRNPDMWPTLQCQSFIDRDRNHQTGQDWVSPEAFFSTQGRQETTPNSRILSFSLRLVTINVQTLEGGESQTEIPGRVLYVRSQLDHCGVTVTGLQETRTKSSDTCVSETHIRFTSACDDKGNGGVEAWFSRTLPYAWENDHPVYFHQHDFRVLAWNPRYLIIRFARGSTRITFAVCHALSATHPDPERWWSSFSCKLRASAQDDEVVLLDDLNTRFADTVEGRVGDLVWPTPHSVPPGLTDILARHDLWIPSTFACCHYGDSHTCYGGRAGYGLISPVIITYRYVFSWSYRRTYKSTYAGLMNSNLRGLSWSVCEDFTRVILVHSEVYFGLCGYTKRDLFFSMACAFPRASVCKT